MPEVGPLPSKTSVRVMDIFTGAAALRASRAATGSIYMVSLAPNPPPISMGMALTLDTGTPHSRAVYSRTVNCPWLLDQTVRLPSSCHWAVPLWGSM